MFYPPLLVTALYAGLEADHSKVDEEQRPMSYTQAFQLVQDAGSYYVLNDIFKLVYG
jgi:hypothetical protein